MEESDDTSLIKSPVVKMDVVDSLKVANECDVVIEKSAEFDCGVDGSKPADEAKGLISATSVMSDNCGVSGDEAVATEEEKVASSPDGGREVGEAKESGIELVGEERLERDDDLSGEKEVGVVGVDVCETVVREDELEVKDVGDTEVEVVAEDKGQDVLEGKDDTNSVSVDVELGCRGELEVNNECEVATQSEVKPDVEEEKLGARVVCEGLPGREIKDESGVEEDDRSVCEAVGDVCEVDCRAGTEAEVGCVVEAKSEIGAEVKSILESDKSLDVVVEEKVIMESVPSESVKEPEEVVENSNLVSSGVLNVAEDLAVEHNNLVLETESDKKDVEMEKKDEEMESVPEVGDEEDEMETEREGDEDRVKGVVSQPDDDSQLAEDEEEERIIEDGPVADIVMETENDAGDAAKVSRGKRKRGKNTKAAGKAQLRNMGLPVQEEDVCFVCFDGGDLVLCDRKNCPKAYHPSCVNRDEKFFQLKGRWNCGWHQCSHTNCQKNAYYMCYTCTFSLCKGCIKDAVILCVRGNKGFCETCINIVTMIEDNTAQGNQAQIDFDDKSSWEYLFKDYWVDLKEKLSISPVEIAQAKNPWKGSDAGAGKHVSPAEQLDTKDDGGFGTDNASDNPEASKPKKRKYKKRLKSRAKQDELTNEALGAGAEGTSTPKSTEWASKELLEFVMHMKDGDRTVLSQFDVQALLLEYIKINNLRDPRRKSQIICDTRLENIFGKARVGHFEMLKLLESHFFLKEDTQIDDVQGTVVDTETNHLDADGNPDSLTKGGKDKKRKTRKKDGRGRQSNLDDYAAIDNHNISLIYLRRKLMEDLLEDNETFNDKVVGTFVRIRISGSNQKQDIYRLVQVIGTSNVDELYKVGKRTTNIMLEILNLNKTEVISIDSISNQDFTEDECKRLRQSIKCGLINRLTVGDILDKAMEIQVARVNDWLESEVQRLTHLRDRASDLGKKKQLRECVESLQLLRTPEERRRRLEDTPEIHADPKMDPNFESEDDDSEIDSNKQEMYTRARGSGFSRRGREPISPGSGDVKDSWSSGRKNSGKGWEFNRHLTNKNLANKVEDAPLNTGISTDNSWNLGRGSETEKPSIVEKSTSATSSEAFGLNRNSASKSDTFNHVESKKSPASSTAPVATASMNISETDKMWHYQDPHGKVQGPFSMVQLRKWSNTGYFPADLRIWSTSGNRDESLLLTDALAGKFQKELPPVDNGIPKSNNTLHNPHLPSPQSARSFESSLHQGQEVQDAVILNPNQNHVSMDSHTNSASRNWAANSVEVPLLSAERTSSNHSGRNNVGNFPSPTPKQSSAGEVGRPIVAVSLPASIEALQSPAVATPDSTRNLTPISERSFPSSHSVFGASSNHEQGSLVGLTNSLQNTQSNAAAQLQGAQSLNQPFNAPETSANANVVPGHNPAVEIQGWGNAPTQNVEANSSNQTSSQESTYAQWTGVQSTPVQNIATNLPMQGTSQLPNMWRPPVQNNQTNMQPNVQWNMGIADNSAPAQNMQIENPNTSWGPMSVIPNMGWAGPNVSMNWVPSVQGPQPGNMNAGWVVPAGNPVAGFQGAVPGNLNQGWVAQPGNPGGIMQMLGTMNATPGWFPNIAPNVQGQMPGNTNSGMTTASSANLGPNVQGQMPANTNSGWSTPSGNTNQGWGPPAGNQGNNRSEHSRNGDKFSNQKDHGSQHGRNWNRQSSFGGGGGSRHGSRGICYQFQDTGHCKRGDSCSFRH